MSDDEYKALALSVAAYCVRNTVIENYHADGKLSDSEMKAFNKEVADKIYTFLTFLLEKSNEEHEAMMRVILKHCPTNWDAPKLDQNFLNSIRIMQA
jgi:hypothetical protein